MSPMPPNKRIHQSLPPQSSKRIESVFSRRSGTERTEEVGASTVGDNDNTLCVSFETEEIVGESIRIRLHRRRLMTDDCSGPTSRG